MKMRSAGKFHLNLPLNPDQILSADRWRKMWLRFTPAQLTEEVGF